MFKNQHNPKCNIRWKISTPLVDYNQAMFTMAKIAEAVYLETQPETVWLLQHPSVYTKGVSAQDNELLNAKGIPVVPVTRGGKFTYHGPGQRIIYPIINLNHRQKDLKKYIYCLEEWIILSLQQLNIKAFRKENYIGVWVNHQEQPKKIAAIGVRATKWVTTHGIALNVNPDLNKFNNIIPCGITNFGVTSLAELGCNCSLFDIDQLLKKAFNMVF